MAHPNGTIEIDTIAFLPLKMHIYSFSGVTWEKWDGISNSSTENEFQTIT